MDAMLMQKMIILFIFFIRFSFASGPGAHQNLYMEKIQSSKKLVEEEHSKFETNPEDLLHFLKGCMAAVFRRPMPSACHDTRRHINIMARKLGALFGMENDLKNFDVLIDENGQLCYSYNLTGEKETPISHCISIEEIIEKLLMRILLNKPTTRGGDQPLCIGLLPGLLILTLFAALILTAMCYHKLRFLHLHSDKELNQVSTYDISGTIKKLMADVQDFQSAFYTQIWKTVFAFKSFKGFVGKAQQLASAIEEEILPDTARICKNLFLKPTELFAKCYCYLKYRKCIASMANLLSIAFGLQKRDDILTAFLKKLHIHLRHFKRKNKSFKPSRLLKRLPNGKHTAFSTKPLKKQSRNSRGKSRGMSIKMLSSNNVALASNSLSKVSTRQVRQPKLKFEAEKVRRGSCSIEAKVTDTDTTGSHTASSNSESFYDVYANGFSKGSTPPKKETVKRAPNLCLSSSCSSDKEVDVEMSGSSSSSRNLIKKVNVQQNLPQTKKIAPQKPPTRLDPQDFPVPCPATNAHISSNIDQISYLWSKEEEFPNHYLTSKKSTNRLPAFKEFESSKIEPENIWSNNLMNVCTNFEQDITSYIPCKLNDTKAFPPVIKSVWPTKQGNQLLIDEWNEANYAPAQNSIKKSYRSESSFNFEDSRFNTPKSNRTNAFEMKQNLPNIAYRSDSMANGNGNLCDISRILNCDRSVNGNEEAKTNVSYLKIESPHTDSQGANNANMQLNFFPTKEILPNVVNAPDTRSNQNKLLSDNSHHLNNTGNLKMEANVKRKDDFLGASSKNLQANTTPMKPNLSNVENLPHLAANQEGFNYDFSHLLHFVNDVNPETNQKLDTGFPGPCDFQDPMSQFHTDFRTPNDSFGPQAFMPPVDQLWGNNFTQYLQPNAAANSAFPQTSNISSDGVAAKLPDASFIFPQNTNAPFAFQQNEQANFLANNVAGAFP